MPCFKPLTAYRSNGGSVVFSELSRSGSVKTLSLPCGKCAGCRLERAREWALRCMHEASMHEENCYVTLTYSDMCLPDFRSLDYRDFQAFIRRLRVRELGREIRFYMCGEYGDEKWRPHFHALIFGYDFPDKVYWRKSPSGDSLFRSAILEGLWTGGFSSIGRVTFESASYVARYVMKKITGQEAETHYEYVDPVSGEVFRRVPEFNRMSLKPGIGARWLDKYESDVYPSGKVVMRGHEGMAPRYYDKRYKKRHPEKFENLEYVREREARLRYLDNTPERLAVKEKVKVAQLLMLKRKLI